MRQKAAPSAMISERSSRYHLQKEQDREQCITGGDVAETHHGRTSQCPGPRDGLYRATEEIQVNRFEAIVLEDSSTVALPNELVTCWQGCGGAPGEGHAAVKLHVRWELKRGSLQGPKLTHGHTSDRSSPFKEEPLPAGSLYIADLGYLDWGCIAARRAAGSYTLTRAQARTMYWTPEGKPLQLDPLLPQQVGQTNELWVRVADEHRYLMRLLIIRVPEEVAKLRRA